MITISPGLNILNGILSEYPIPRLTIILVFFFSYKPLSYLGKNVTSGDSTPLSIIGILASPP